jgi:hypothetical protein
MQESGFLSAAYKSCRLAAIHTQLQLPAPTPKIKIAVALLAAMRYGTNIAQCPHCGTGKLQLRSTWVYYNLKLVNIKELKARGSPSKPKETLWQ